MAQFKKPWSNLGRQFPKLDRSECFHLNCFTSLLWTCDGFKLYRYVASNDLLFGFLRVNRSAASASAHKWSNFGNSPLKILSTQTNWTCKWMCNIIQTWHERFVWTREKRPISILCYVQSTIRCEPNLVDCFANTKGIYDNVLATVFTVRQCGQTKLSANDDQLLPK